jgi:hypothetical protein
LRGQRETAVRGQRETVPGDILRETAIAGTERVRGCGDRKRRSLVVGTDRGSVSSEHNVIYQTAHTVVSQH